MPPVPLPLYHMTRNPLKGMLAPHNHVALSTRTVRSPDTADRAVTGKAPVDVAVKASADLGARGGVPRGGHMLSGW